MAWEKVKLGDVCVSIADGDHLPPPKADCGIPFVTISNITSANQFDFTNTMFVPQEYYDSLDEKRKPKVNDILYSVVGSFGKPVFIKDDSPFVFQRHIAILRPDESKIYSRYLYYKMLSNDFYMMADAVAVGAAQRTVSLTALRNMEINIPNKETQKRIADILSAYDDLIENNQKQIKLLEEAAQRLYKQWFIDLKFPGYETTPIVDGLPQGWWKEKLGDVVDYVRGTSYTSNELSDNEGVLLVNLKNINAFGGYKRNAEKRFTGKYKENGILESGDLVMGCTDMTKERRLVGHVALIPNLKECAIFTMDLLKILPKTISKTFFYAQCRFGGLSYKISPLANGANVLHLRPENMADIEVLCPEKSIVEMYDNVFASMISKIEKLEDQIQLAAESRNRLLPKIMNGEISV
ncbi:type I restriction-modification system, S subunit [Fibrobacter succinogenes subsp. succinogenes S85]|uniref:Restriction modification system DNA specificity domain protein n=1 Tax=Fibrobacter succinogenes (strain ATCC 19169 / S85) TaxID=59374 RepID=C9RQV7_FIBSS|nr:restriction endonuclease subunit S [Fibrobacter succinogenes]ACX74943.1 restriction modification system DNA specificity domain protein [Fibrobacter succinogenes subsp. succinogenes S85]ADL26011.1 type I restriction-modification system, S subunit [Fibrobacter succinogenes subsp. succinogenes S85]